jgi:hypothetical protein
MISSNIITTRRRVITQKTTDYINIAAEIKVIVSLFNPPHIEHTTLHISVLHTHLAHTTILSGYVTVKSGSVFVKENGSHKGLYSVFLSNIR